MVSSLPVTISTTAEASAIAAQILSWFTRSEASIAAEHILAEQVKAIANPFLATTSVSSEIDLNPLIEKFTDHQVPVEPEELTHYLHDLTERVVAHSIHTASPRFIGHMTTALPYFVRPLTQLITAMNQNVVKTETAKALTPCERQVLAKLHRLIYGCSDDFYANHIQNLHSTLGIVVSGGTIANITALWCARNAAFSPKENFTGITEEGLAAALHAYGERGAVIIGSSLMHYSFDKAADLLGLGSQGLIKVPANRKNQVDVTALRQVVRECRDRHQRIIAIVGVAGTTDSGGIDPLAELADIAQDAQIHFHVDAAWGGAALFSRQHRHKLAGIERADSVTLDGHKQLYLPTGIGMLFLRNPHLASLIEKAAPYTVRKESMDLGKRSLEGSRPATALLLHAGLHLIGMQGYEFLVDDSIRKAHYLAQQISTLSTFELLAEPDLNILIYRYIPQPLQQKAAQGMLTPVENHQINQCNEQLQKQQRQAGFTFISRTTTHTTRYGEVPIVALRAVIANPLTTAADMDAVLAEQMAIGAEIGAVLAAG